MQNKLKIFFIAPALSMGGMERASANTANGFQEAGCEVIFLNLFRKEHFFKLKDEILILEPNKFNVTELSLYKSIKWIRREVKKHKPDKVIVFNKLYGAITALALFGTNYDFYLSERSSPLFIWKFPFNSINRLAYFLKPPKGVIAQTQIAANFQREYFKNSKIKVVPNSVKHVKLYPEIARQNVILAVGRLNDYLKGFDLLLESFALLKNKDWQLHFAGGDENAELLKIQALKLGISSRVKFLGAIKDIDICFAYASIYVIPSRSEGFPNALAEAMAAGCCCVSFDFIAGPRDLIKNGENGLIVENGNVVELSETLDYLILNRELRLSLSNSALEIRNTLSLKKIIDEKIKFLNLT